MSPIPRPLAGMPLDVARNAFEVLLTWSGPGTIRTPMYDMIPEPQHEAVFAAAAEWTITKTADAADQIAAAHL